MKTKTIIVLKNKTLNVMDSRVDLEGVEVVEVVSKEDATRVVVAVLEADVDVGVMMVTRVGVGVMTVIEIDVGVVIEVVAEVAEVAVISGVVAVISEVVAVVVEVAVEVVSRVGNLGAETIGIATDQENHGEIMKAVTEEVLGGVSIKGNLLISQDHLKIKKLLSINVNDCT